MKFRPIIILFFVTTVLKAQNLIPNGSFESYTTCPISLGQIEEAQGWWSPSGGASPDYLNSCSGNMGVPNNSFGTQNAFHGNAYAGIALFITSPANFREYVEIALTNSLVSGTCYYFEMYVTLADKFCRNSTDDIGAYFSDTAIVNYPNFFTLPFSPQITNQAGNYPDTSGWKKVSGNFIASGGEKFLILGNFRNNLSTNLVSVDPSNRSTEVYIFLDAVSLVPCSVAATQKIDPASAVKVYPNPFRSELNFIMEEQIDMEIVIYNSCGIEMQRHSTTESIQVKTGLFPPGLYIYEITTKNGPTIRGKILRELFL